MQELEDGGRRQKKAETMKSRMCTGVKTWNPFKGCLFDCVYCRPSFQAQAKRQKHNCMDCCNYVPHEHPERLDRIPSTDTVFVCGNGDISFCNPEYTRGIISKVANHPGRTFYFQSKRPEYFKAFLGEFSANVILVTTLETNKDDVYRGISKTPLPSERYEQFKGLEYPRKVLTVEPMIDFDPDVFAAWVAAIAPEYVWLGFNSRPKQVQMLEPTEAKVTEFIKALKADGIEMRGAYGLGHTYLIGLGEIVDPGPDFP
jgi:hypothetical protein